jgi:hypothetical protein
VGIWQSAFVGPAPCTDQLIRCPVSVLFVLFVVRVRVPPSCSSVSVLFARHNLGGLPTAYPLTFPHSHPATRYDLSSNSSGSLEAASPASSCGGSHGAGSESQCAPLPPPPPPSQSQSQSTHTSLNMRWPAPAHLPSPSHTPGPGAGAAVLSDAVLGLGLGSGQTVLKRKSAPPPAPEEHPHHLHQHHHQHQHQHQHQPWLAFDSERERNVAGVLRRLYQPPPASLAFPVPSPAGLNSSQRVSPDQYVADPYAAPGSAASAPSPASGAGTGTITSLAL